ncbi:MAG: hypothetical protein IJM76_05855 [Lachnospiraceae bacterium]|nr:hypothetical protein [Lachnospiraceae bacterium]
MDVNRILESLRQIRLKLQFRMDADEEEEEEPKKVPQGHANTRLPYGLCKSEGIDTTGMTPREAWEAYEGKTGVSPDQAYKEHFGGKGEKKEPDNNGDPKRKPWKKGDPIKSAEEYYDAADEKNRIYKEFVTRFTPAVERAESAAEYGGLKDAFGLTEEEEEKWVKTLNDVNDIKVAMDEHLGLPARNNAPKYVTSKTGGSISDCANGAQLFHYMEKTHGVKIDESLRHDITDIGTLKGMMTGYEKMANEFPDIKSVVGNIVPDTAGWMCYNWADHHVGVTVSHFTNRDEMQRKIDNAGKDHTWINGATPETLMVHEMAHALERYIVENCGEYDDDIRIDKDRFKVYGANGRETCAVASSRDYEAKKITDNAFKAYKKMPEYEGLNVVKTMFRNVSHYAATNRAEMLAEAFHDVAINGGNAHPLSRLIRDRAIRRLRTVIRNKKAREAVNGGQS